MYSKNTQLSSLCQHPILVSKGAHGHTEVCICVCAHACVLPVKLLTVASSGSDLKSVPKADDGQQVLIGVLETEKSYINQYMNTK